MRIDKDTQIFGSFAKTAGNNGCKMFNAAFNYYRLNALYKSFSVDDICKSVESARTLNFKGFAITMPFKKEVLKYVDELSEEVLKIGSANTVINNDGILKAYNTDYMSAKEILYDYYQNTPHNRLVILGDGGYSAAVQHSSKILGLDFKLITRNNWDEIKNIRDSIVFNCTPVYIDDIHKSNDYIDCLITTETGKKLSLIQADYQFKLYTGLDFPISSIRIHTEIFEI